jgi:hypothetical protein
MSATQQLNAWLRSGTCKHGHGIIFWKEYGHRTFTYAFYNYVSRGRPSIIERVQIKTHQTTGGLRAAVAGKHSQCNGYHLLSMERSARRECAVLDGKMKIGG